MNAAYLESPRVSQIELIHDVTRALERRGFKTLLPRQMNAVIAGVNKIIEAVSVPYRPAKPNSTLAEWMQSDDVGTSSMFLATTLAGHAGISYRMPIGFRFENESVHPLDADDFRRCVMLFEAVPELKPFLNHMAFGNGPVWRALAIHWEELEALFREEMPRARMPRFQKRLDELVKSAD